MMIMSLETRQFFYDPQLLSLIISAFFVLTQETNLQSSYQEDEQHQACRFLSVPP